MYRYYIVFIISTLLSFIAKAEGTGNGVLTGIVRDIDGKLIEGAVVEVPDLKTGTVTDSAGHYRIENVPSGKYVVVVSMLSYAKTTITITIDGEVHHDFLLNESAIESKEVVITGQTKATEINRSPVPVVAINNQFLRTNVSSNIIDALTSVPGVSAVSTGPNISKPFIRGLGYNRVLTLFDGMRQEGQQWGDEHGIEVDEYGIDRVELVKGPSSLIYGSDALAGVVNLIPTPHAADGKIIGEVTGEYQMNNNLLGGSGMMTGNQKGFYWIGRVSHKQGMDYRNPVDGKVYGTNFNETDAGASFGINKSWGFTHLDLSLFNDLQAIPDGSRDSATRQFTKQITEADLSRPVVSNKELNSYTLPDLHQHVQHYRALLSNNFNTGSGVLVVNAGFESSSRREFSHPEAISIPGLYLQMNTYTYDVKYHLNSIAHWDISAGVNGMYQVNDVTRGTDFIIPSYHQFDIGPFVVIKKNFRKLDVAGGIRYDNRLFHNSSLYTNTNPATGFDMPVGGSSAGATQVFSNFDHTFTGVTYSLGMTYIFSKAFAVKGNLARGFRAPNIVEISSNGVHPGTNTYQMGNPDFKPEFSLQEDIGAEFTSPHVSVNISVFNNDITGYIYNQGLDTVIVPGKQTFRYMAGNARLYGGEASIDIHPHPLDWLHFENSISLVYAMNEGEGGVRVTDSNKYLPFIPPVHVISELRANFKHPARHIANTFIKVQAAIYARQDRIYLANNSETQTPGYTLINAGAGGDVTNKAGKVLFNIGIFGNNIFDVAYEDHMSRLKYFEPYPGDPRGNTGIYSMGRNLGIKLSVPFSVK